MGRYRARMRDWSMHWRPRDALRSGRPAGPVRRALLASCALMAPLAAMAQPAATFPRQAAAVVVASAQGSGVDILVRAFAERLRVITGTAAIVENKPGASGLLAANYFVTLPADGHTLLSITSSSMNLVPLMQKVPYDEALIRPVIGFSRHTGMIVSSAASGVTTLKQIVDEARAKPGAMNVGTYSAHFQVALKALEKQVGATFNNVPYKAAAGPVPERGRRLIPLALADLGTAVRYVETGKVRAVATAADVRHPSFPDVPTFAELGFPATRSTRSRASASTARRPRPRSGRWRRCCSGWPPTRSTRSSRAGCRGRCSRRSGQGLRGDARAAPGAAARIAARVGRAGQVAARRCS